VNATSGDLLANYLSGDDTYFTLAQIAEDLSGLLGKQVDLHVRKSLHPFLRDKVLSQPRRCMSQHDERLPSHEMLEHAREALQMIEGRERAEIRTNRMLQLSLNT
jgi:hypothetical protein